MGFHRRKFLRLAVAVVALPATSRVATALTYPTRPIRLVVPFPPSGAADAVGRPWADNCNMRRGPMSELADFGYRALLDGGSTKPKFKTNAKVVWPAWRFGQWRDGVECVA